MNQIIGVNECNMLVDKKLKEDRMYGTMPLNIKQNMNVIIRKKGDSLRSDSISSWSLLFTGKNHFRQVSQEQALHNMARLE